MSAALWKQRTFGEWSNILQLEQQIACGNATMPTFKWQRMGVIMPQHLEKHNVHPPMPWRVNLEFGRGLCCSRATRRVKQGSHFVCCTVLLVHVKYLRDRKVRYQTNKWGETYGLGNLWKKPPFVCLEVRHDLLSKGEQTWKQREFPFRGLQWFVDLKTCTLCHFMSLGGHKAPMKVFVCSAIVYSGWAKFVLAE